jgi:hypothetical protein
MTSASGSHIPCLRRGDDLAAVEYLQKIDPKIERKSVNAMFGNILLTIIFL